MPPTPAQDQRRQPGQTLHRAWPVGAALAGVAAALLWRSMRRPPVPPGVVAVRGWDLRRYMGRWYEVARVDNGFEQGLERTQAEYTALPDGSVHVLNRGYDPRRRRWKVARGKARLAQGADVAALEVSFFGPFYGGYNVVALDPDYRWALVIGSRPRYCWILSRTPQLPAGLSAGLRAQARLLGVPVEQLQWVLQDGVNPTGSW